LNGAQGIAVGMATNMPPHNLRETVDAINAYIDNPEISVAELMQYLKAPDFPTGGIIYGYQGVREAYETGRGKIIVRARSHMEEIGNREAIVVTEIPYLVNKADLIKKAADLVNEKKIEGISMIKDESDRKGMRIVFYLKKDAIPHVVLNQLYKYTPLQSSFNVNNIALVKGRPQLLNLKDLIKHYVDHRHEVLIRKTRFELRKAKERAHILEGLIIASDHIDEVIAIIRSSAHADEARQRLMERFELTEIQAKAIVEMRLRQLTGLEQDKLRSEYADLLKKIEDLTDILENEPRRMELLKAEMTEIKEKYGDERRTEIDFSGGDVSIEDLIPNDNMVITISHAGYIKRTPLSEYRVQNRGGKGQKGVSTRAEDFPEHIFAAKNHDYVLFFTQNGKVYWLRVFEIPEGSKVSKGRAIQNLINIDKGDKIKAILNTKDLRDKDFVNSHYVIMATKKGMVKKTPLEQYSRPRQSGINAITIREGDELLDAKLTTGDSQIMLAAKSGKAIRFDESKTRPMGRTASGVRGILLENEDDEVIGMISVQDPMTDVLVVSEKGYGKRSKVEDYRLTNRGGKGVKTINITGKTGKLIAIKNVTDQDDLMLITKKGLTIRMPVQTIPVLGRAAQGVRVIKIKDDDEIASVAKIANGSDVDEVDGREPADEPSHPTGQNDNNDKS